MLLWCAQNEVTEAWRILPSEAIVIRLHFCCSQYLTGPGEPQHHSCKADSPLLIWHFILWCSPATAPSVEVFQPSNRDHFTLGKQLKKLVIMTITWLAETAAEMNSSGSSSFLFLSILTDFISRQWNRVANESMGTPAKSRDSWFKPRGTIKNIHATLNVWIPQSKYATSECILADWSCFWAWVLWSGPATFRRLPAEKRSFYQQWSWIASQTTQAHTLSRTLRGSSSPTPPVERSGFLLEFRQIQIFPTSLAIYDSFTEGDGLCGQISSTSRCQTAGGVAFLLTGHWTL